ncbi:unnamed protein product [Taenia asiatica]|uniref:Uncharacterized protein n=1 Tax=Taenia asiatica TaxID=60517 RepID=A0A0R3WG82_TAEAS|nr:unnamed protein product [Taenia asiatica]
MERRTYNAEVESSSLSRGTLLTSLPPTIPVNCQPYPTYHPTTFCALLSAAACLLGQIVQDETRQGGLAVKKLERESCMPGDVGGRQAGRQAGTYMT